MTLGNSRSEMERVEIEVATGDFCHSKYDLLIKNPELRKPRETKVNHRHFPILVCDGKSND